MSRSCCALSVVVLWLGACLLFGSTGCGASDADVGGVQGLAAADDAGNGVGEPEPEPSTRSPRVVGSDTEDGHGADGEPTAEPRVDDTDPLCFGGAAGDLDADWARVTLGSHASARRVEMVGGAAYVADGYGTTTSWWLHVLELSAEELTGGPIGGGDDPWVGAKRAAYDLLVDGDVAYVATSDGLVVVDVSEPLLPTVVATLEVGPLSGLTRVGGQLIGQRWNGLIAFDVASDPAMPVLDGELAVEGSGLIVSGQRAYLVGPDDSIEVFELLEPAGDSGPGPALGAVGSYQADGWILGGSLAAQGDVVYVVEGFKDGPGKPSAALRALDLSHPGAPTVLDSVALPFDWVGRSLWLDEPAEGVGGEAGPVLYVSDAAGVRRFDVSAPGQLKSLGPALVGCAGRVTTTTGHVQLACGAEVRLATRPVPVPWGTTPIGAGFGTYDLAVWGGYAYVATGQAVEVVNVQDPMTPVRGTRFHGFNGFTSSVLVHDDFLVIGEHPKIRVRSLAVDPAAPPVVTSIDATGGPSSYLASARDTLLFTTAQKELGVVDFSAPTQPGPVSWVGLPQEGSGGNDTIARALAADGDVAYVGSVTGSVTALSITAPGVVAIASELPTALNQRVLDLVVEGDRLYARSGGALAIYDRSKPLTPTLLGVYTALVGDPVPAAGWKRDRMAVQGHHVFLTDRSATANVQVLDVSDPDNVSVVLSDVFPAAPRTVRVQGDQVLITTGEQVIVRRLCSL